MPAIKKIFCSMIYALSLTSLSWLKLSFIIGSKIAFFSINQCFTLVPGFFGGPLQNIVIFMVKTLMTLCTSSWSIAALAYHVPTLSGALWLASENRLIKISIPLGCMVLFIAHPVGALVPYYILYWILPCVLPCINQLKLSHSIFIRALASTLTCHAVGSVLWLYSHHTDAAFWNSLIPVVWIERLLFATIITAAYYGVWVLKKKVSDIKTIATHPCENLA